jgi:peptidoglycan/xylan/chitin deacetylase (PgdA/CDA1 family)/glycosyltransferase involved in cell wall biosynthesis
MRPSIAVIVTCYNLGRTVGEAVESAVNQTMSPAELLVVDDGSDDVYTLQALSALRRAGHHVLRTPNRGVCAARNLGIRQTVSPYIVLLDADDILQPTYLEKAAAALEADDSLGFVSCGMESFGEAQDVWFPQSPDLIESLTRGVVHVSSMFRRQLWLDVGGFDETFEAHEEIDFWTSAVERGYRGHVLQEPLLRYRIRSASMYQTAVQRPRHLRLMERFYRKHQTLVNGHAEALLLAKERFILDQKEYLESLDRRRDGLLAERDRLDGEIRAAAEKLTALNRPLVDLGELKTKPVSHVWGLDRGEPVDRRYIAKFLGEHRSDIRGRVLEIKDRSYTHLFGSDRVVASDVLDIDRSNTSATIFADLQRADGVPDDQYDCFILTQTLGEIFDVRAALHHSRRMLKLGGVLLCTVPATGRITLEGAGLDGDFWRFTEASIRSLFADVFGVDSFEIVGFGNALACTAFLHGFATHEIAPTDLDAYDPYYPVVYGIRAVKSVSEPRTGSVQSNESAERTPARLDANLILMYHRIGEGSDAASSLGVTPDNFRAHLRCLSDAQVRVVPLAELARMLREGAAPTRVVALTFDDGYQDALTTASPLLEEFGFPATFFVVSRALQEPHEFWWDTLDRIFDPGARLPALVSVETSAGVRLESVGEGKDRQHAHELIKEQFYRLDSSEREARLRELLSWSGLPAGGSTDRRPMDAAAVRQLATKPRHDIGVHTANHVWLPGASTETLREEINDAKHCLEELLGKPISTFSFPYGAFDQTAVEVVRCAGFEVAVTTEPAPAVKGADVHCLPRIEVGDLDRRGFVDLLAKYGLYVPQGALAKVPGGGRVLVAGWFSFAEGHATAGDLFARDLVCEWLASLGRSFDVAAVPPFEGDVDWRSADPMDYSDVVFVCGPFARGEGLELDFLERFRSSRTIGVNLSMLVPLDAWSPFDRLFERDSSERTRPDLVFLARPPLVPVIGVCLVEAYEGGNTELANAAIERLLADREVSRISIDTRLDVNTTDLRTPREIESTIARMDALVTTRLHGMVLALKNGVPVVAIDPEPGGGKIQKQGRALNWPYVFVVDNVSDSDLRRALDRCLERGAGAEARLCAERARSKLAALRNEFVAALSSPRDSEEGSDR